MYAVPFSVADVLLIVFLVVIPEGDLLCAFAVVVASEIGPGFSLMSLTLYLGSEKGGGELKRRSNL
jgi:hypothetical protein